MDAPMRARFHHELRQIDRSVADLNPTQYPQFDDPLRTLHSWGHPDLSRQAAPLARLRDEVSGDPAAMRRATRMWGSIAREESHIERRMVRSSRNDPAIRQAARHVHVVGQSGEVMHAVCRHAERLSFLGRLMINGVLSELVGSLYHNVIRNALDGLGNETVVDVARAGYEISRATASAMTLTKRITLAMGLLGKVASRYGRGSLHAGGWTPDESEESESEPDDADDDFEPPGVLDDLDGQDWSDDVWESDEVMDSLADPVESLTEELHQVAEVAQELDFDPDIWGSWGREWAAEYHLEVEEIALFTEQTSWELADLPDVDGFSAS